MNRSIQELRARLDRTNGSSSRPSKLRRHLDKLTHSEPLSQKTDSALQDATPLADFLKGQWKQRPSGRVLTIEREFPGQHLHGGLRLQKLYSTEPELVSLLARDRSFIDFHPENALFFDTETTGLAGGAGTYVFLVGVGYFDQGRFRVHQLFLPDLKSEKAFLEELNDIVQRGRQGRGFRYLVSFNGKSYDLNLLSNRFILQRLEQPFSHLVHLDLLYPIRVLWKGCFKDCRLQTLEEKILGVHRQEDIPSSLIPRTYFNYLRTGQYRPFREVFEHNRLDLLSMVTLLAQASQLVREPDEHLGVDPIIAARVHILNNEYKQAEALLEDSSRQDKWQSRTSNILFQLAKVKKKLGYKDEVLSLCSQVIDHHPFPPSDVFEEAAKVLEHHKKELDSALQIVHRGLELYPNSPSLLHRRFRLECRIAGKRWY